MGNLLAVWAIDDSWSEGVSPASDRDFGRMANRGRRGISKPTGGRDARDPSYRRPFFLW